MIVHISSPEGKLNIIPNVEREWDIRDKHSFHLRDALQVIQDFHILHYSTHKLHFIAIKLPSGRMSKLRDTYVRYI